MRKSLDLHGSCYPTLFSNARQWTNNLGPSFFTLESHSTLRRLCRDSVLYLRLAHCSSLLIDVLKELAHRSLIERAVVLPPPLYHRVVEPRHFGQRHVGLAMNRQPRTACRIRCKASSLAPGRKLVKSRSCLL